MSQLRLINTVDVPRGDWTFLVEETGVRVKAGSVRRLKVMVRQHLDANRIAVPPGLDELVEDMACRNLGKWDHWCTDAPVPVAAGARARSRWNVRDVLRFLKTIIAWGSKTGFAFVDQAEAERRAAICATCPLNVQVSGCLGCSGVSKLVRHIRNKRTTSFDPNLHTCEACGCELKVKVLVPLDVIDNTGVEYPEHCWQVA